MPVLVKSHAIFQSLWLPKHSGSEFNNGLSGSLRSARLDTSSASAVGIRDFFRKDLWPP